MCFHEQPDQQCFPSNPDLFKSLRTEMSFQFQSVNDVHKVNKGTLMTLLMIMYMNVLALDRNKTTFIGSDAK